MFSEDIDFSVDISWHSAIKEYLLSKEAEGYAVGTLKTARSAIGRFSDFCIDNKVLLPVKVTRRVLRQYLSSMRERGYAPTYCNAHLSKLRGFFNFMVLEDYMKEEEDPTLRLKFMPKDTKLLVSFNDSEIREILHVAGNNRNKFFAERDKLMIMIMADCGLRVNELVTLLDKNVSTDSLFIHKAKRRKQRLLYVTPAVGKQVIKYRRIRDAYFKNKSMPKNGMFFRGFRGESLSNDAVQGMLRRLEAKCNIRSTVRVSPHTFRHWFAQQQLMNGIDIYTLSKLLGHTSINTTQLYLTGIADEQLVKSAIATSPLLNMGKNRD